MATGVVRRRETLTLEKASMIADAALAAGRRHGFEPLTVAVLDAGGHPVVLKREDGSGILRADVAIGKAYGALGLGVSSRDLRAVAVDRPMFTTAVTVAAEGRFVPVAGGVLILDEAGEAIGAVGVSGDTSDNDERCAIEAVKAAGLRAAPEEPSAS